MQPQTRFARLGDACIAYQVLGEGPVDLVLTLGSFNNVDYWWEDPSTAHFLRDLARFSRLILFDRRGTGASDPASGDLPAWEDWMGDLEAVMDAVGSEQAAIFACVDGSIMALPFAATFPDRVSKLVLYNASARLLRDEDYPFGLERATAETMFDAWNEVWGTEEGAEFVYPERAGDQPFARWYARFQRSAMSRAAHKEYLQQAQNFDLRPVLPLVQAPTLVLHRKEFGFFGIEHGRYLADHLSDATFVELPGNGVIIAIDDLDVVADHIERFVTGAGAARALVKRALATVLFTDVVGSTERAAAIGDDRWRDVLQMHEELTRKYVDQFGGRLIKTTGDGVLAIFEGPGRAVLCAVELRDALEEKHLPIRAGIHAGEIESREDGDIGGIAVHLAARVLSAADPGEVLASSTVRDLVIGGRANFEDRGMHRLKGVPDEWRLFSVV